MRPRKGKPDELRRDSNGGLNAPPFCFVCSRVVDAVPMEAQLAARRHVNVPVWLASPGASSKHPQGVVRHAYCAPLTTRYERWQGRKQGPGDVPGGLGAQAPGPPHRPLTDVPPCEGAGSEGEGPTGPPRGLRGPDAGAAPDGARVEGALYDVAHRVLIDGALAALDLFSEDELEAHAAMLRERGRGAR